MSTLQVDIVSAEGHIFTGQASMVIAPASHGDLGVTPQHTPLLTTLRAGEVRVQSKGQDEQFFFVGGGILEIQPTGVTVLADTAARAKDLDEAAALEAKQRAEERLADMGSDVEVGGAQAQLAAALAQLALIEKLRKTAGRR